MIYLDSGATSFPKPEAVIRAMTRALRSCANPGRGGYDAAVRASEIVLDCRLQASSLFDCQPEQVVFTGSCTQGLNMAIRSLVRPGDPVVISGFEHNAVTRPLYGLGAKIIIAGRRLFDWDDTLEHFENVLRAGVRAAIFTHVSNAFGYILPVEQMAQLCKRYAVPFVIDAAQSAGSLPVHLQELGADFIAMPGHKGLLGPQGTGLLLCARLPEPLVRGGTGSLSALQEMPEFLPDRGEAGTLNVPGIAGLKAGMELVSQMGLERIFSRERLQARHCAKALAQLGLKVFSGPHQGGTVSFVPPEDCEDFAQKLAAQGIAVRAGLHCAPYAHESAGTLDAGTVRVSFGMDADPVQAEAFLRAASKLRAGEF